MSEEVQKKIEIAHKMVTDLCKGRRKWIMSIPAREDYDPDIVIGSALRAASRRIKELEMQLSERV